jgi:hypothetical protein
MCLCWPLAHVADDVACRGAALEMLLAKLMACRAIASIQVGFAGFKLLSWLKYSSELDPCKV